MAKNKKATSKEIFGRLRTDILNGTLPGRYSLGPHIRQHLPDMSITDKPLRTALDVLLTDGLAMLTDSGICVSQVSASDLPGSVVSRLSVESLAAYKAAKCVEEHEKIRSCYERMEALSSREKLNGTESIDFLVADLDFHLAVASSLKWTSAENTIRNAYYSIVLARVAKSKLDATEAQLLTNEHKCILDAIVGKQPDHAVEETSKHLMGTLHRWFKSAELEFLQHLPNVFRGLLKDDIIKSSPTD